MTKPCDLIARIPRDRFAPLPGKNRKTGIELEFSGLTEDGSARIAADLLGGDIRADGPEQTVTGSAIGDLKIYLDTAYRDRAEGALLDLARKVVPVELVTDPVSEADLPKVDALFTALREAGATGTKAGLLLGFGLHLNPQIASDDPACLGAVLRAFALMEDWLRYADPMDTSRRVLPFSDPYPRDFVDLAARGLPGDRDALFRAYLDANPTRNRGLDMQPIIEELSPGLIEKVTGETGATSARPTWHYRLPDSRLGDPGWSLAYEWNRWVMVERLAQDDARLDDLARRWLDYRAALTTTRLDWMKVLGTELADLVPT